MTLIHSIILGIVQGLAEFLPISSSAHLIIIPWLLKWPEHTLAFDIALHLGTLTAIIIYFFKDYIMIIGNGLMKPKTQEGKLFWYIIIASIPAAVFGLILNKIVEDIFRGQILVIAVVIFIFGIIIFLVDKLIKKEKNILQLNILHAFLIGLSQAFALFPGVSRSGITITIGMGLGYKRADAARFSFLLSGPVIFGAGILSLLKNYKTVQNELYFFTVGFITAVIFGLLSIHFLLSYLKKHSFTPFIIYRIALASFIVMIFIIRK